MVDEMTSPEESRIPVLEAKPLVSLETIVSPPPEKVKELTKGTWADDWRAIKEKLAPEEIPVLTREVEDWLNYYHPRRSHLSLGMKPPLRSC